MKITVVFEPNIEKDTQSFDIEDMDMTQEEWTNLSEDEKNPLYTKSNKTISME